MMLDSPGPTLAPAPPCPTKVFNDPVHGHIELDDVCVQVMDTPQFQRLRSLKQMGVSCFVFPGATHTRFEHSLGVCHLAGELIDHLRKRQPELAISDNDAKCVRIAALCHDLGHGPFSHLFDNGFLKAVVPGSLWQHEQGSEDMLDYLVADNPVDISPSELRFIKDLIHGEPRSDYPQARKLYLFDIVANKRNSVDVDKFDYIQRDCLHMGLKLSLDAGRLIKFARVIDNQICYHQKEAMNLCELFHTRYSLFKRVYTHKVSTAIEYMVTDALILANDHLNIAGRINSMPTYVHLTDLVLNEIECSTAPALEPARSIILRLRRRDLYRLADQVILPVDLHDYIDDTVISAEIIAKYQDEPPGSKLHFTKDELIVQRLVLSFAMKDKHPLDTIRFYRKYNNVDSFLIPKDQISEFIPNKCEEVVIRIYSKDYDKTPAMQKAFRHLLAELNHTLELDSGLRGTEEELAPTRSNSISQASITDNEDSDDQDHDIHNGHEPSSKMQATFDAAGSPAGRSAVSARSTLAHSSNDPQSQVVTSRFATATPTADSPNNPFLVRPASLEQARPASKPRASLPPPRSLRSSTSQQHDPKPAQSQSQSARTTRDRAQTATSPKRIVENVALSLPDDLSLHESPNKRQRLSNRRKSGI
ncbi:hypothetical protein BC831DRAFT_467066 [Entophlyctis helioformis]|nr:hypothetical protein BC831DRAFT_467066 [Entophlyctis helioformis]